MLADLKPFLSRPMTAQLLCLGLSLLLVWELTVDLHALFSLKQSTGLQKTKRLEKKQEATHDLITRVLQTPFFGDYLPQNIDDAAVKQSMLNLSLVGIMFAGSEEESHVIIRTASGREQSYHVGDTLPGGVILKRIRPEGVLVLHHGILESLTLPKTELIFEAPSKPLKTRE